MFHRRQSAPEAPAELHRYQMRQKLFSIGDDFYIENEHQQRVFRVDGKALRLRQTLLFEDLHGHELLKIQTKVLRVRETMEIEGGRGVVARVHSALVSPLRDRYKIEIPGGADLSAHGNILDHEYMIEQQGQRIAEISKKWFRLKDTYGVEIAPGHDDVLLLAITTVIDMMSHEGR
jgi:uncharacterized protein YxjI